MIPGLRIGRYEVAECLGKGAFGVVHRARDAELGAEGSYAAALAQLERVAPCAPAVAQKAYLAACRSKSFPAAKRWFRRLAPNRDQLSQICLKQGFDPRAP